MFNHTNHLKIEDINFDALVKLPIIIFCKDTTSKYLWCNQTILNDGNLTSMNELINHTDNADHLPWQKAATTLQTSDQECLKTRRNKTYYEWAIQADGTYINMQSQKIPLYNKMNKLIGLLGFSVITSQIQAEPLTPREQDCLHYTLQGMTAKDIANELNISRRTVESYLENVKDKWHCQNKAELIIRAAQIMR
jgi:DNA-binding CsgD family transcriptional regulator